jgi:putative phosphoesterase
MSDSHRDTAQVEQLLSLYAKHVQAVIHLGDLKDDLLSFSRAYPSLEMHAVAGNCDFFQSDVQEKIITVNGSRILLTHGHLQNVKSNYDRIAYYAEEKEVNACFFGHTHRSDEFVRGPVYFFNPGSIGRPRAGERPSYGLVGVSDSGVVKGKILEL